MPMSRRRKLLLFALARVTFEMLLLEPDVFVAQIAAHLLPHGALPRGYLARDDYAALGFVARTRLSRR